MAAANASLRLGCVGYLNALPLIEGLRKCADVTVLLAAPSALAGMLERGEADVALLSLVDSQRIPGGVTLIPAGIIASDGPTLSVRLFSDRPLSQIRAVHADADSHTAVTLMRILLARAHGAAPEIVPFRPGSASTSERPAAMLLIGDKAVHAAPPAADYPHTLDLGEAWKTLTGDPFAYACWACLETNEHSDATRRAWALLDRQRRHNATRLDWVASSRAAQRHWPAPLARQYLGELLRFDDQGRASPIRRSIEQFFDWSAAAGLLERRPTRWLDEIEPAPDADSPAEFAAGPPCPV